MKNKYVKLLILVFVAVGAFSARAASSDSTSSTVNLDRPWNLVKTTDVGVGAKWGTLTGIDVKYWTSENKSWDFTIASADNNTLLGVDYLIHLRELTAEMMKNRSAKNIAPYFGVGFLSSFGKNKSSIQIFDHEKDSTNLALRVPLGIEYLPTNLRIGFFAELGLGLGVAPKTYTFASGDLGARFYF